MPFADLPTMRMYYELVGRGKPLLLLHGAMGTGTAHFAPHIPVLAVNHSLIIPDMRGYGRSTKRSGPDRDFFQHDAEDLRMLLDVLGLPRVEVCGFSDGGTTGLCLAARYPELVSLLVACGAQATVDEEDLRQFGPFFELERIPLAIQAEFAEQHGIQYWQDLVRWYMEAQIELIRAGGDNIGASLNQITCPVLLLHGGRDKMVPLHHAYYLCRHIPQSLLVILQDSGHDLPLRRPRFFAAAVQAYLGMKQEEGHEAAGEYLQAFETALNASLTLLETSLSGGGYEIETRESGGRTLWYRSTQQ